jgi:cysteine desulfurase/selenocysteine lyase
MSAAVSLRTTPPAVEPPFDLARVRRDFPILELKVNGHPLAYLDNAASAQMPTPVLDRLIRYQTQEHANIHRAVHTLSETATAGYEGARRKIRHFINAREEREIVYTRGTTDAVNLVMHGYGRAFLGEGDEIILSQLEHHSNIVPWQMLCEEKGCKLRVIPCDDAGVLLLDEYERLLNPRTKLVAVTHVSNALGTINPVATIVALAHERGVPVLLDGAQAVPHLAVDMQALDCDFYCFSGHKMCGPTGIGILYGKAALLERMRPYQGGGDMILSVSFEKTTYNAIPHKFEAGTPPIAAAIGLGAATDYLSEIGMDKIAAWEHELLAYATEQLGSLAGVRLIGTAKHKAAVLSFEVQGVHPHDVGTILNEEGVAVRTGHHCAQPVMQRFGVPATVRASFSFYNTFGEVDQLVAGIRRVQKMFG